MSTIERPVNVKFDVEIDRIYLKEVFFKVHDTPNVFALKWRPEMSLNFKTYQQELESGSLEVVLVVDLKGKLAGKLAVEVKLEQAGVFRISSSLPEKRRNSIPAMCMTALFPYAREAVDNLAAKGSLPPFLIGVFDFDKLLKTAMAEISNVEPGLTEGSSEVIN